MAFKGGEPSSPFDLVERSYPFPHQVYDDFKQGYSGVAFDQDITVISALRRQYPNHVLTTVQLGNVNLMYFAAAGNALAKLDTESEVVHRIRGYLQGPKRGMKGSLADSTRFAKYNYNWLGEEFIVYVVQTGFYVYAYVLKEPAEGETVSDRSKVTDALIKAVGEWQAPSEGDHVIYVFDGYWSLSRDLWDQVDKASWKDVILDEKTKKSLTDITKKFFDSKDVYKDLGVPWRRGIIFHGPVGNGKTISIKALMHTLNYREHPIPSLYVKSANQTWHIRAVFLMARRMAPCLLIFEDIDTIVTPNLRSYFFNEVDGLEQNDGIMIVASTNHLDQLDPGLSKRPSRFDRKYLFPLPSLDERTLYCGYWREKLRNRDSIQFPKVLCRAIAEITDEFSFAYLKEAFVSTLLAIAKNRSDEDGDDDGNSSDVGNSEDDDDDYDVYELWREMKKQVKILRDDMETSTECSESSFGHSAFSCMTGGPPGMMARDVDAMVGLTPFDALKRDATMGEMTRHLPQPVEGPACVNNGLEFYPDQMLKNMEV